MGHLKHHPYSKTQQLVLSKTIPSSRPNRLAKEPATTFLKTTSKGIIETFLFNCSVFDNFSMKCVSKPSAFNFSKINEVILII